MRERGKKRGKRREGRGEESYLGDGGGGHARATAAARDVVEHHRNANLGLGLEMLHDSVLLGVGFFLGFGDSEVGGLIFLGDGGEDDVASNTVPQALHATHLAPGWACCSKG